MSFWKRIRFKIARLLDRNPNFCWADLVSWVNGYTSLREAWGTGCRKSNSNTPYAYCGKCEKTGKFYEEVKE